MADVRRIVDETDPVARNFQITQAYFELSQDLARRIAPCANWCTFATWASKQAGVTIRGEDLGRVFARLAGESSELGQALSRVVTLLLRLRPAHQDPASLRALVHEALSPAAAVQRASEPIASGNRVVFDEIGQAFARFAALFAGKEMPEPPLRAFVGRFRPGDPPHGQGLLARAFTHYHDALVATDPKARDERMLLANLEVGLHEQTRLQPEIETALGAPLIDPSQLAQRLIDRLLPGGERVAALALGTLSVVRDPLARACERLVEAVRDEIRQALTKTLMGVRLPDRRLRLGEDLEARQKEYPDTLRDLRDPELVALVERLDPTPTSFAGSGAKNWADLAERMHYATDYFRAYHNHAPLLEPPFPPEQVREIKQGRVPLAHPAAD